MEGYIKNNRDDPITQQLRFKHKSGQIVWILSRRKGILDKQKKLVRMIGALTKISDLKQTEHALGMLAYRDFLTKVPNKPAFSDALTRAIARCKRKQTSFAVFYVDIDNFKKINDLWNHSFGDKVLCEVAKKLQQSSRTIDFLARLGGDEFGILLEDHASQDEILAIADRYISIFSDPLLIDTTSLSVTLSIGIAFYPEHGDTYETLLHHVDQAMYRAKKLGKNQFSL
jgi:diguanylate cyclase (GGDEF)-like protein